jgi:hypothetical protein
MNDLEQVQKDSDVKCKRLEEVFGNDWFVGLSPELLEKLYNAMIVYENKKEGETK